MPAILRCGTPMQDWRSFKFTHTISGLTMTEGELYMIQHTVGVLILDIQYGSQGEKEAKTIVEDEDGVLFYHAEKIMVDKFVRTGSAFLPGDKVYWSGVQGDSVHPWHRSADWWIGICVVAAGDTDDQVMIDLKGDKASTTEPL